MSYLFDGSGITVDRAWIRSEGNSYAISQVRSVRLASYRKGNGLWQVAALFAPIMLAVAASMYERRASDWTQPFGIGLACTVAAILFYRLSRNQVHRVYLSQGPAEMILLETEDGRKARDLRAAIERAIAHPHSER